MSEPDHPSPAHTSVGHADDDAHAHGDHSMGHVMPMSVLFGTFGALILLTLVTVATSYMHLGDFEIWLSMGIATFKVCLVLLYFMHLRYDRPFNAFTFCFSLIFLGLFLGGTLTDSWQYQPSIEAERMNQEVAPPVMAADEEAAEG